MAYTTLNPATDSDCPRVAADFVRRHAFANVRASMTLCLTLAIAGIPTLSCAQSQYEFKVPAPSAIASPAPGKDTLELPPAYGPSLPPAPPPLERVEIPSPFLGCWEGNPNSWDYLSDSFGSATIGKPGRIVFCYRSNRIDVPLAKIAMHADDWIKNALFHAGLGLTIPGVDQEHVSTQIYAITSTQIWARTFVPLKSLELVFWIIPMRTRYLLTDEELATLTDPNTVMVHARQELDAGDVQSLRYWHAEFYRIPDPTADTE